MAEIKLTTANFEEEVLKAEGLVLVDFWAEWCGPCKMLAPTVAEIAEEYAGTIKVGKVNIDDNMDLAQKFRIVSIPTLLLFKDGKVKDMMVGYAGKEEIEEMWK